MRRIAPLVMLVLLLLLSSGTVWALSQWTETWEGYTSDVGPYEGWGLQTGSWGRLTSPGLDSNKCYSIDQGQTSRIRQFVDLDHASYGDQPHIVLQGWLYDSGGLNNSMLGLAGDNTADDNSMIRIGATGAANYQIQYFDGLQSPNLITVDTGMPVEPGWHFVRLDISFTPNWLNIWNVTWRVWNAARTVQNMGEFGWWFARVDSNYVTVGAPSPTPGAVAWDSIQVGPIADVGPPPPIQGDTTAPTIVSVTSSPARVPRGAPVTVTVVATDNVAVTSVTADSTPLAYGGANTWTGTIPARSGPGTHFIPVVARDASNNETTDSSASYVTDVTVGVPVRTLLAGGLADDVAGILTFRTWGKVTSKGYDYFFLSDGSEPAVKVYCPYHNLWAGTRVQVTGTWNPTAIPGAQLETTYEGIKEL